MRRLTFLLLATLLWVAAPASAQVTVWPPQLPVTTGCAPDDVVKWNGTAFVCAAVTGAGLGDVTASGTLAADAIALGNGTTTIKTTTTAAGIVTLLGTPSSANLFAALTDETGSAAGALAVFSKAPIINNLVASAPADAISLAVRRNSAGQTANLVEFQTEANAFLAGFDKAGNLIFGATNPADSGVIRLENAAALAWENATPGTDLTLTVDSGNLLTYSGIVNPASLGSGSSITTKFLRGDSTWQTVSGSAITGTDTRVLFFDGTDSPAGDAGFTYNKTTDSATLVGSLTVAALAYDATSWNNNQTVPTRDDLRDVIETIPTVSGTPAQGDLLYYSGSAWTLLVAGTNGQFLKTQGAGANPLWATLAGGGNTTSTSLEVNNFTKADGANSIVESNFSEPSAGLMQATTIGGAQNALTYSAGRDGNANAQLGSVTVRGADETGAGGANTIGGLLYLRGGNNTATNTASQAGSVEIGPGASTGATQGQQGLLNINYVYVKGGGTSTQWNLQCFTAAMTVNDCGASPSVIAGIADTVGSNTVQVHAIGSQAPINASAAVTAGHTVCAGTTAGKVTDSGGTAPCNDGFTVGVVAAVSGAWTLGDGTTFTASTTLPLVQIARTQGSGNLVTGADPADAGSIRLSNADLIAWEASPAGTDITLTVNSSEQFVFSAAILSPTFVTPALGTPASGTLNLFSGFVWDGGVCQNTTASLGLSLPASNPATAVCKTGTNTQFAVAQFSTTGLSAQGKVPILEATASTTVTIKGQYIGETTSSGNVTWRFSYARVAAGGTLDPSWTDVDITDAAGTADQLNNFSGTATISSLAAGDLLFWKITYQTAPTTPGVHDLINLAVLPLLAKPIGG